MCEKSYAEWRDARIAQLMEQEKFNLYDLCDIVVILRGEGGCPWDCEQDHHSIRKGLIEECYEVVESIDKEDPELMREELGDLLLQIVFHADIEKDAGRFDIDDVARDECLKMIHRHPHVFGTVKVDDSAEVLRNWETIKTEEKQRTSLADKLTAIPPMMPALMRAQKMGKKAEVDAQATVASLGTDIGEMLASLEGADPIAAREILGHALLSMTSLARLLQVEAEEALTEELERLIARATEE